MAMYPIKGIRFVTRDNEIVTVIKPQRFNKKEPLFHIAIQDKEGNNQPHMPMWTPKQLLGEWHNIATLERFLKQECSD